MPKEPTLKKVRKGTKSCVECRQRKIRCIWSTEGAESCQNCEARGRQCVSQIYSAGASDPIKVTSRERIGRLETSVKTLRASVHRLEARLGVESANDVQLEDGNDVSVAEGDDSSDSQSDLSAVNPPAHLKQLFDNELLGTPTAGYAVTPDEKESHSRTALGRLRRILQRLMPSKDDVAVIQRFMNTWLSLVKQFFPASSFLQTGSGVLEHYEEMQSDAVHPVAVASYLIPLAITMQHVPRELIGSVLTSIKDGPTFVRQVSDAIEQNLIANDMLLTTLEGIEMSLMFARLQLVQAKIRKLWLGLRRIIAIAEMIGLQRASYLIDPSESLHEQDSRSRRKAAAAQMWEAILAVDRISNLMFNLPLGTASYEFRLPASVMVNGAVHLPYMLAHLTGAATSIQDIEDLHAARRPQQEIFEKVLKTDCDVRAAGAMAPREWWESTQDGSADAILQFWYFYLQVRIHLQLALKNNESNQYAYSHTRCLQACRETTKRYAKLRAALPAGFFACRLLDLQALTPAIFLLHTWHRPGSQNQLYAQTDASMESPAMLIQQILNAMEAIQDQPGGDFAREVGAAIRSVVEILETGNSGEPRTLTLRVPLLGKIQVGRKVATQKPTITTRASASSFGGFPQQLSPSISTNHTTQYGSSDLITSVDLEAANSMDWIMEISDDFSFLPEDFGDSEQLFLGNFDTPP